MTTQADLSPTAGGATTAATATSADAADVAPLDQLRLAINRMLGAERRLRSREHAPGELTHAHIRSLHTLAEQGEMTAGQLARSADLNPASVTAMLDHLEQSGIVARTRSTTDRRVTNVALTPEGREVLATKSARWQQLWRERLDEFTDDELAASARVTCAVAELFDSLASEKEHAAPRS